jgi:peptide/nickel transport system substrate-binding protein
MNNVVWGGLGTIANDIFDPSDPEYNHSLPQRVQDIPQAKSLLKAAGHENLTVTLVTSPIFAGCLSVAQVFASQAAAAGVTVNLNQVTPTALFGSSYKKWTFAQDFWYETAYLPQVATEFLPTGPYNETHWDNPHYFALYNEAFATSNSSLRKEIVHEMQVIDYKDGSLIIPYFTATIDGLANNVGGVKPGQVGYSFGNWSFHNMWLS